MPLRDAQVRRIAGEHRGAPERRIAAVAARQDGMVSTEQLALLGVPKNATSRRLVAGKLHPVLRGVHAVGHPQVTRRGRWHAALLASGPEATLSHRSGGELRGVLAPRPGPVDVTVPGAKGRRRRGVRSHSGRLDPRDVELWEGLPVTTLSRTMLDLAEQISLRELVDALDRAEALRQYRPDEMADVLARARGRRGQRPLRRALLITRPQEVLTRSRLERRALKLVRVHRLPRPEVNVKLEGFEVDLLWRDARLAVEVDGRAWHGDGGAFESDRRRDTTLMIHGWRVARFTWRQVLNQPAWVASSLRALIDAGGG
ncbi:MAG TPA: type IV toxin-antitoxin system AbiEi family antitoxin domain-containing protein [Capillimicrobium sp.]